MLLKVWKDPTPRYVLAIYFWCLQVQVLSEKQDPAAEALSMKYLATKAISSGFLAARLKLKIRTLYGNGHK